MSYEAADVRRISTKIRGLDKLLYEGLDIIKRPFTIVIRGGAGSESTLFGLQLLYGIALSLHEEPHPSPLLDKVVPHFITSCHRKDDINTVIVNTFISSCMYLLTKRITEHSYRATDLSKITRIFFDTSNIVCSPKSEYYPTLPTVEIIQVPDRLIAESVLYYNNLTGALHYRTANNIADMSNLIYWRACSSVSEYLQKYLAENDTLYDLLHTRLIDMTFDKIERNSLDSAIFAVKNKGKTGLLALELDDTREYSSKDMRELIAALKETAQISLLIVDDETRIPANDADILIDLYNKPQNNYVLHYLNLIQCSHQEAMLGEHQYKKMDYGIEVFPNNHTYFETKRNFHRSLLYTHSSVIEDTYQQYLSRKTEAGETNAAYNDYVKNKELFTKKTMQSLHPFNKVQLVSYDILNKIFMPRKTGGASSDNNTGNGLVTAVIGNANTYKRYLTTGSAFSSAVRNEDTLIIILNKEKHLVQRRMACPARMRHNCYKKHCEECYRHFHFMNIYPEYITCDEFIYMLDQDIRLPYNKGEKRFVKRIIIDDLQILDYSFPLLKGDEDFLSAIMSVCREKGISLYILCDKGAKSRDCLKALSDNVVCTEKTDSGQPKVYVERCSGYYNPPSKMYCGIITKIEELFECNEKFDEDNNQSFDFAISPVHIDDRPVPNIDDFWK